MAIDNTITIPRRTLLVAASASGLLVACGGGSEEETQEPVTSPSSQSTPSSTPSGTASAPSEGGPAIAAVADVPVGGGTINKTDHVVVTQPADGQFKGFTSICTHQGCDVSTVADNVISCGCHGSQFSAETGEVERGPASRPLAEVAVAVAGDNIVRA